MYEFLTRVFSETGNREKNEDACVALRIVDDTYFLAVADGMGGNIGGEAASKLVLASLSEYFTNIFKDFIPANDLKQILEDAFLTAQNSVARHVRAFPELKGMGTTLTILLIHGTNYVWGNIGDSRLYLVRDAGIKLITSDHTQVAEYLKKGGEELPQKILDQYKNIVTRIVDGGKDVPDIYPPAKEYSILEEGDMFLLCSDGLIVDKSVDIGSHLLTITNSNLSLTTISQNLINWAMENGSNDNISVVLGKYTLTKK